MSFKGKCALAIVYVEFTPSVKRWSNWTGLYILEVMQIASMTVGAERIIVITIDGYTKYFTLIQVADGKMLIGYLGNNHHLSHTEEGSYRLFASVDQHSGCSTG